MMNTRCIILTASFLAAPGFSHSGGKIQEETFSIIDVNLNLEQLKKVISKMEGGKNSVLQAKGVEMFPLSSPFSKSGDIKSKVKVIGKFIKQKNSASNPISLHVRVEQEGGKYSLGAQVELKFSKISDTDGTPLFSELVGAKITNVSPNSATAKSWRRLSVRKDFRSLARPFVQLSLRAFLE